MNNQVAVFGASGYTGRELCKLLLDHPEFNLSHVFSRNQEWALSHELAHPKADKVETATLDKTTLSALQLSLCFLATPADVSAASAPALLDHGIKVVDLSGGFRLQAPDYPSWYKFEHPSAELLDKACYGLHPWITPDPSQNLVSNPGCYATASLLSLLPLYKAQKVNQHQAVIIDAKSGVSGAGRSASDSLLYGQVHESMRTYKFNQHQHVPEIKHYVQQLSGITPTLSFTTHVLPMFRGISLSVYFPECALTVEEALHCFDSAYASYPLVTTHALSASPTPSLATNYVAGTPQTHIHVGKQDNTLCIITTMDNLLKGAASQALENANALFGLPTQLGVSPIMEKQL